MHAHTHARNFTIKNNLAYEHETQTKCRAWIRWRTRALFSPHELEFYTKRIEINSAVTRRV